MYIVDDISFGVDAHGIGFEIRKGDTILAEYLVSNKGFVLKPTEEYNKVDNQEALTKVVTYSQTILNAYNERSYIKAVQA